MPGTFKMLKSTDGSNRPPWMPKPENYQKDGAFYYVSSSISKYKKASVLITLPTSYRLRASGSDWGRNAFISLGVSGDKGAIDIGLRNPSRFGEKEDHAAEEALTDRGHGWEAVCYEVGTDNMHRATPGSANKAPSGTVRAKVDVRPNSGNKITLYVEWLDKNNRVLANYLQTFTLDQTYKWDGFYRFASLVTSNPDASMNDKTFVIGGTFETAYLLDADDKTYNWGIDSSEKSWIVTPSKCSVPYRWAVGEQFSIDYR